MIGDVVRTQRLALRLSQVTLGQRTGLSQNYISKLERGEIDLPQRGTLDVLARELHIQVADFYRAAGVLEGVENEPQQQVPEVQAQYDAETLRYAEIGRQVMGVVRAYSPELIEVVAPRRVPDNMRTFPVVNRVPASDASVRDSQLHDTIDIPEWFWRGAEDPRVYYVTGDCMSGQGIVDGDHAIIDAAKKSPRHGQTVIAHLNGALTLKRFMWVDGRVELHPNAPGYEPILVGDEDELEIVGCLHKVYPTGER